MLPLEIIRMKAKGCRVRLRGNNPGFTLPSNIGELGDDIVELGLFNCSLQGTTCCIAPTLHRGERGENWGARARERRALTDCSCRALPRCAGAIPESIGSLSNLQHLDLRINDLSGA